MRLSLKLACWCIIPGDSKELGINPFTKDIVVLPESLQLDLPLSGMEHPPFGLATAELSFEELPSILDMPLSWNSEYEGRNHFVDITQDLKRGHVRQFEDLGEPPSHAERQDTEGDDSPNVS